MRFLVGLVLGCLVSCSTAIDHSHLFRSLRHGQHQHVISAADTHTHTHTNTHMDMMESAPPIKEVVTAFCKDNDSLDWSKWDAKAAQAACNKVKGAPGEESKAYEASKWDYIEHKDGTGRIVSVQSNAPGGVNLGVKTNVQPGGHAYCNLLWVANQRNKCSDVLNSGTYTRTREIHSGHIIAASIGGSQVDPRNFMPQYYRSNIGDAWRAMEKFVVAVAQLKTKAGIQCSEILELKVDLEYSDATGGFFWMPKGGTYSMYSPDPDCQKTITNEVLEKNAVYTTGPHFRLPSTTVYIYTAKWVMYP